MDVELVFGWRQRALHLGNFGQRRELSPENGVEAPEFIEIVAKDLDAQIAFRAPAGAAALECGCEPRDHFERVHGARFQIVLREVAVGDVDERDAQAAGVDPLGKDGRHAAAAADIERDQLAGALGDGLAHGLFAFAGHGKGLVEVVVHRGRQVDRDHRLIVPGHEVALDARRQEEGQDDEDDEQRDDDPAVGEAKIEQPAVTLKQPLKGAAALRSAGGGRIGRDRSFARRIAVSVLPEPAAGSERHKAERDEERDDEGEADGHRHVAKQDASHAAHEQDRHEDRERGERRGGHCQADIRGAADRGLTQRHAVRAQAEDVLQNDDAVVDDEPHRERQARHGDDVERHAREVHHEEGGEQ